jgi:hypothetical protein
MTLDLPQNCPLAAQRESPCVVLLGMPIIREAQHFDLVVWAAKQVQISG